jgi:hypothetical protein
MSAVSHLHDGFKGAGKELAEQRPLSFGEILQTLLPPKLATAKVPSEPHIIMEKLNSVGKTSWFVFKYALRVVHAASSPYPHLQQALEAFLFVLDQLNVSVALTYNQGRKLRIQQIMKDAQHGFLEASSKVSSLQFILYRHRRSQDSQAQERLASFAE